MRSCEKICELILTPRPCPDSPLSGLSQQDSVMLPAMAFCGLKLSKLFSKQAHVILKQYLNKLENNEVHGEARRKHWRQDEWEIEKEKLVIVAGISISGDRGTEDVPWLAEGGGRGPY